MLSLARMLLIAGRKWGGAGDCGGTPAAPRRRLLLLLTGRPGAASGCHIPTELRHATNA